MFIHIILINNLSGYHSASGLRNVLPPTQMWTHRLYQHNPPEVMVVEDIAVFSLSSVLFTTWCFEFSGCSAAVFAFSRVFTACGESWAAISAESRREFESSGTLCNVETLHAVFASSSVLTSFSDENERRLFISLSLLLAVEVLSTSCEFKVGLNMFDTSAIVLNVPAGCSSHCIMGNVDLQCCVHVTRKDTKNKHPFENPEHPVIRY